MRIVLCGDGDEATGEQPLLVEVGAFQIRIVADGEIDIARLQLLRQDRGCRREHLKPQMLPVAAQGADQERREETFTNVAHRDAEFPIRTLGVEHRRAEQVGLDASQDVAHRLDHGQGFRGRLHARLDAYEQRVIERLAHLQQGVAHRRLAQPQFTPRNRHVAVLHHRVEHHQQVQVQLTKIHISNFHYSVSLIDEYS
ncbi:hypothetical protein D3C76_799970 [compost metagenome]